MTKKKQPKNIEENIIDINYEEELSQSYIDYAMSVIGDRALPDVRDGLKPVQRRILFTMKELNNYPDKPFKKSARIVGDTMGKYHPHGDCLRGTTKVMLSNGDIMTMKELYDINEDQRVLAINKEGKIVVAMASNFRVGQQTNEIYQIVLTNGSIIEVTDNHPFLKSNLKYAKADKLKVLDELFTVNKNGNELNVAEEPLKVEAIRIKNVVLEEMYDFTVEEHENMLIVSSDDENQLISVHNSSIYEAMARMSQDFIIPNPLVEGHGNFGSIDGDRPAAARYCVTGDTLINTNKGIFQIKDIVKENQDNNDYDINLTIQSIQGTNKAVKFFNSGLSDIYEITTEQGYTLKGSPNHPILVSNTGKIEDARWVLLEDIKKGDIAVIRGNSIQNSYDKQVLSRSEIINMVEKFDTELTLLSKSENEKLLRARNIEQNFFLAQLFNRFAFVQEGHLLLRGSPEFLRQIQIMLISKGILATYSQIEVKKAVLKIYNYDNLLVFFKKIGFMMNNKVKHLDLNLKDIKDETEGEDYSFFPIKEVKKLDKQETIYSLKVDSECHSFVSNGFISHNTEARLSPLALNFLEDLDNDVVDMKKNFDETLDEPIVLPVKFPNLLVNGTSGIAVGMATSIPPHNINEVCNGAIKYLEKPDIVLSQLLQTIKGPDFPTGGIITNKKDLNQMYKTGEGRVTIRSRIVVEEGSYGRTRFVITEVPYNFAGNKERLINNIIDTADKGDLDEVIDVIDESSADGIRIVIETKRGTNEKFFINKLYSKTQAQMNYRYSFTVIKDGKPVTMGLLEYMDSFVEFQREIYTRKYNNRLVKISAREEILEGLLIAHDKLDAVIESIRGSNSVSKARTCLMTGKTTGIKFSKKTSEKIAKAFKFTRNQADAILQMKLQRLVGIEKAALEKELKEIQEEIKFINSILESQEKLDKEIIKRLKIIAKNNKAKRKTSIIEDELEEVVEVIEEEELYVLYDKDGYIKSIDENSFNRTSKDNFKDFKLIKKIKNTDKLYFFTAKGKLHQIDVLDIPKTRVRDKGENVYNIFDIKNDKVVKIISYPEKESKLLFVTKGGYVKKVEKEDLISTRKTVIGTKLQKGDELIDVVEIPDDEEFDVLALVADNGYIIKFSLDEVSTYGKAAMGTIGMKVDKNAGVIKAIPFNSNKPTFLECYIDGKETSKRLNSINIQKRNNKGRQVAEKSIQLKETKIQL